MFRQRRSISILICILYFFCVPLQVRADNLQNDLQPVQQQELQLNSQFNSQEQHKSAIITKILSLQQSIQILNETILTTQTDLSEQQKQLQELETKQVELQAQCQQQNAELGRLLKNDYENYAIIPYVALLFQATSWLDFLNHWEDVHTIVSSYTQLLKDVQVTSQNVSNQQSLIKEKTVSIQLSLQSMNEMQQLQQQTLTSQQEILTQLNDQEKATMLTALTAEPQVNSVEQLLKEQTLETELVASGHKAGINPTNSVGSIAVPVSIPDGVMSILSYAEQFLGTPYVWGGTSASPGFDCSGYVQHVFQHFGIQLDRIAEAQYTEGISVSLSELKPGDLVFFSTYAPGASHVGIYIGFNIMIDSKSSGVSFDNLTNSYWASRFLGARRVINS